MKYRKLLCVAMVLVLLLGLSGSGFALTLDKISTNPIGTVTGVVEEKIFSKATLEDDFADNRVLVVLNNAASLKLKTYTAADFPEIQCASVSDLSTAAKTRVTAKLKGEDVAAACGAKSDSIVFSDFYEVDVQKYNQILCLTLPTAGKQNVLAAMKLLMQREDVMYAGPDYVYNLCAVTQNDPYYSQQWGHQKIKLPDAWEINRGSANVLVGVLDSGIEASHADFYGKVNTNRSRDFVVDPTNPYSALEDLNGHGTHVAGIIAAKWNALGVAGVTDNVLVASLRVFDENGYGYARDVIEAIDYAEDYGMPILNFSGRFYAGGSNNYYDPALEAKVEDYPGLFVCAAGNENLDNEYLLIFPANYEFDNVITVGASTENDTKCSFSNYSQQTVDIFAPGENIISTYRYGIWYSMSGTSMAAPYVTGVAALMLSQCPGLSAADMKDIIINNDDNISALSGYCRSGGRLNAYKALKNAHTFVAFGANYVCLHCVMIVDSIPNY